MCVHKTGRKMDYMGGKNLPVPLPGKEKKAFLVRSKKKSLHRESP